MVLLGRYVSSSPSSSMMCCVLRVLLRHISNKVWPKGQSTSALQEMSASWAAFWISFFASNNAQQQQKILTFLISFWWGVKLLNGQRTRIAQCRKFPKKVSTLQVCFLISQHLCVHFGKQMKFRHLCLWHSNQCFCLIGLIQDYFDNIILSTFVSKLKWSSVNETFLDNFGKLWRF